MAAHGKAHVSLVSTARLLQLMMCIGVHTEEAPVDGGPWTRMLSGYWMCRVCVCTLRGLGDPEWVVALQSHCSQEAAAASACSLRRSRGTLGAVTVIRE